MNFRLIYILILKPLKLPYLYKIYGSCERVRPPLGVTIVRSTRERAKEYGRSKTLHTLKRDVYLRSIIRAPYVFKFNNKN